MERMLALVEARKVDVVITPSSQAC
jgi:hypothetical protein